MSVRAIVGLGAMCALAACAPGEIGGALVPPPGATNKAPTVNAGADLEVIDGDVIELNGTVDDDGLPADSQLTLTWISVDGLAQLDAPAALRTGVVVPGPGRFVIRLSATDGELSASDELELTVRPRIDPDPNLAPEVDAGSDLNATVRVPAALMGSATDDGLPDGSALQLEWRHISGPGQASFSVTSSAATEVTFDTAGEHTLELFATDGELSATDQVTVTVLDAPPENQAPTVNAGGSQTITLPALAVLDGAVSDDGLPMNGTLVIQWQRVTGPGIATFDDDTSPMTSAAFDTPGDYLLRLTADDGELASFQDVMITVLPEVVLNEAPVVNAGPSTSVVLPSAATLMGSVSDDGLPNGTLLIAWTMVSGPGTASFADDTQPMTTVTFDLEGTYMLRLSADDGALLSSSDVTVTVSLAPPTNLPPSVSAGPSSTVRLPSAATLAGTVTDDGLPSGSLTITWSRQSGPGTVTFANPSAPATTATFSTAGTYGLRLTANDGALSASSNVTITVQPPLNQAPVVNAGATQSIGWPGPATLAGTATDDGLPSGSLTITWSQQSGPGTVTFQSAAMAATTATFSLPGTYVMRLTANDGALASSSNVTVNVAPPPNAPPNVNAGPDRAITLPGNATLSGTATDDGYPVGSTLVTTWSRVSGPGTVTFANPNAPATTATFSTAGTYVLRLTGNDSALNASDDMTVVVNPVPPMNQAPIVDAGPDRNITLPGNATLSGTASDDGLPTGSTLVTTWSRVSGPGTVTFANPNAPATTATFSTSGTYVLRLTANDSALSSSDDMTVVVNPVPPVNQAPIVNAGPDRNITVPGNATLSGTASDDGLPTGSTLVTTWSRVSGPGTVTFANPNVPATIATFSTSGTYVLRLTGNDSALSASDDMTVVVNPVPPVNQAPIVNAGPDRNITLPGNATLSGTASDDGLPTGSTLVATWSRVSGPGTVTFANPNAPATTATFSTSGTYVLRLTGNDSALSASDDMTVVVNPAPPVMPTVLMFVAYNDVWWPEYKVTYEALRASGYAVEVRSSATGFATSDYSSDTDQTPSAQGLDPTYPAPVSYGQFTALYQQAFGATWNAGWNARANIPIAGRIQDVPNMNPYVALVIPGGRGQVAYRYDGTYADLSPGNAPGTHVTIAADVQAAAIRLNGLVQDALTQGKPVAAECHGAPIVAFARVPSTTGGPGNLGRSILSGRYATGYPFFDGDTPARYQSLSVTLISPERVVVDGPRAPDFNGNGRDVVITSTDWYPETVTYFTRTLLNALQTYPTPTERTRPLQVLVFGGDEPTNYPPQTPARYTDLVTLLNDASDDLAITAVGTDAESSITAANLAGYDVLVYFRHNAIAQARQNTIAAWVDGGGGLVGLHHAIFNQGNGNNTVVNLFGGELPSGAQLNDEMGLVYSGESNHIINVNYGHFVSTYGVHLLAGQPAATGNYTTPMGVPNENLDNDPARGYFSFTIQASDELYPGAVFNAGASFGRGLGQINRLFSNDRFVSNSPNPNNGHYDTAGWVRLYDPTNDGTVGRIVYLQPGETNTRTLAHASFRQAVKNAVVWASN